MLNTYEGLILCTKSLICCDNYCYLTQINESVPTGQAARKITEITEVTKCGRKCPDKILRRLDQEYHQFNYLYSKIYEVIKTI